MPHKYNAARRHHIARPKQRVTNWADYNEALRQRGSLTVWFTDDAIAAWKAAPRTTPGGQPHYSDLAITTALTLRAVFRNAQTNESLALDARQIMRIMAGDLEEVYGTEFPLAELDRSLREMREYAERA